MILLRNGFFLVVQGRERARFFSLLSGDFHRLTYRVTSPHRVAYTIYDEGSPSYVRRVGNVQALRSVIVHQVRGAVFSLFYHFYFGQVRRLRRWVGITLLGQVFKVFVFQLTRSFTVFRTLYPFGVMSAIRVLSVEDRTLRPVDSFTHSETTFRATRLLRVNRLNCFRPIRPSFPTRTYTAR